jgi:hypothetical protein
MDYIHNKIISFSLWGSQKIYNYGMVENVIIAKELYPDWTCYIYLGKDVIPEVKEFLSKQENAVIIDRSEYPKKLSNMVWRFEPAFYSKSIVIIRDSDSRLNIREKLAVDEWLNSDKDVHIMRDHQNHNFVILGGMWGVRNGVLNNFKDIFEDYQKKISNKYFHDMDLLKNKIYNNIVNNSIIHVRFPQKYEKHAKLFPPSNYKGFVGEIIEHTPIASKIFNDPQTKFIQVRDTE